MTLSKKCPRCRSTDTARSHRKAAEHLLLGLRPYRCNKCQHRFYCLFFSRQTHA